MRYENDSKNVIWTDSMTSIHWVNGSVPSKGSKHIDVRLYNLRHLAEDKKIKLQYVKTEVNPADILSRWMSRNSGHYLTLFWVIYCWRELKWRVMILGMMNNLKEKEVKGSKESTLVMSY